MEASRWGGRSGLVIALDPPSVERVRALAVHPELRGDHVTLAYGVARESFDPAWVPGGYPLGATVPLRAVAVCRDERVQALLVEVAGSRRRPWDGACLHVTVSRQPDARSADANAMLEAAAPEPIELSLGGVVRWAE